MFNKWSMCNRVIQNGAVQVCAPNPKLANEAGLPRGYGEFPMELHSRPIVDLDDYYAGTTFMAVTKGGTIFR